MMLSWAWILLPWICTRFFVTYEVGQVLFFLLTVQAAPFWLLLGGYSAELIPCEDQRKRQLLWTAGVALSSLVLIVGLSVAQAFGVRGGVEVLAVAVSLLSHLATAHFKRLNSSDPFLVYWSPAFLAVILLGSALLPSAHSVIWVAVVFWLIQATVLNWKLIQIGEIEIQWDGFREILPEFKRVLYYGVLGLLGVSIQFGDQFVLGARLPSHQYAIYGFGLTFTWLGLWIDQKVFEPVLPRIEESFSQGRVSDALRLFRNRLKWILLLSIPVLMLVLKHRGFVIHAFLGEKYAEWKGLLPGFLVLFLLRTYPYDLLFRVRKQTEGLIWVTVIYGVAIPLLSYLVSFDGNLSGVLNLVIGLQGSLVIVGLEWARRDLGITWEEAFPWRDLFRFLLLSSLIWLPWGEWALILYLPASAILSRWMTDPYEEHTLFGTQIWTKQEWKVWRHSILSGGIKSAVPTYEVSGVKQKLAALFIQRRPTT